MMSADNDAVTRAQRRRVLELAIKPVVRPISHDHGREARIFPVNFATRRRTVLFRIAQGTKLYSAMVGDWVAFEADYHDPSLTYGWSVIIKGRAHLLSANADILDAEEAPLRP